eukprot:scaffold31729_cov23-Prasinocladus_malaysianus.AAC.1
MKAGGLVSAVHMFISPRGRQCTDAQAPEIVHAKMPCPYAWEAIICVMAFILNRCCTNNARPSTASPFAQKSSADFTSAIYVVDQDIAQMP